MRLIDADAAIDAVVGCTNCGTEDVLREYVIKHSLENGWTGGIVDALDAIEQLPSIQPEHCGDAVSRNAIVQKLNKMDRYVSAELRLCDTDKKFPQNEVFIVDDVYEEIVDQLPSVQPERLTDDDFETIRVHLNAYKEKLCNQKRWEEAEEYQRIIDRFMTFASAQPERTCVNCGRTANNGGWYADGGTRCPIEEHYALPKDGYCHLWEKRNVTDDDYPERRTDEE